MVVTGKNEIRCCQSDDGSKDSKVVTSMALKQKSPLLKATVKTDQSPSSSNGRQEKSLGENCRKFIKFFGAKLFNLPSREVINNTSQIINVDDCIEKLCIGRRRIYDIINILESFQMIKRLKKNEYEIKAIRYIKEMISDIEVSLQNLTIIYFYPCRNHILKIHRSLELVWNQV